MTPDLWPRVKTALADIQALAPDAAVRYLRDLERVDPEAAARARSLIASAPTCSAEPAPPPAAVPPDPAPTPTFPPPGPPKAGSTADWSPGAARAVGRYELVRVVGRGGFGEVWEGFDPVLRKRVAVKVPRPGVLRPRPPAAFLDEARKAGSLRHPALVPVLDAGETDGGWYIVSDYVDGPSLQARLAAGGLTREAGVRAVAAVAGALHAAHLAGLTHRDVKPGNILLDAAGNAYLADFGLAVREDEQAGERDKVSGTPAYMSPEQVRGDAHLLDGRTDIYSLGAVLYEVLTGRPVVRADTFAGYHEQILHREPRPPRAIDDTIPAELERVCLKCLAKDVRDRYTTAQDLARDLTTWFGRTAPPPPARVGLRSWPVAAGGLAAIGITAGWLVVARGPVDASGRPTAHPPLPPPAAGVPATRAPAVEELLWPRDCATCKWEVLARTNELRVYTDRNSLLQLGVARPGEDWELRLSVRQLSPAGRVGVFFGHAVDLHTHRASVEVVQALRFDDGMHLHRSVRGYDVRQSSPGIENRVVATAPVRWDNGPSEIGVRVRGGRVVGVTLNGEPRPDLAGPDSAHPAHGPFGVYVSRSEGVFSRVLLNGNPVRLTGPEI